MPRSKHTYHGMSRGGHHNDQTTAGRLEHVLESDPRTFSTLATIITNERSEGGCTHSERCSGAAASLARLALLVVMSGRHMRARSVALGAVIVRHGLASDASNGRHVGTLSTKPRPFRPYGEPQGRRRAEIEVHPPQN